MRGAVPPRDCGRSPPGPATVLLLAVWIGLIAGFLDLGLLVVNRRLINRDFYRLGGDFTWIIPGGVTILVLVPAIVIAFIARIRGGADRLGAAVWVLSFVGFLDLCARLPLERLGIVDFVRWARHAIGPAGTACAGRRFSRLVRRTVPLLAGTLLMIMLVTIGGRAWSEHRAVAALPPPPPAPATCC